MKDLIKKYNNLRGRITTKAQLQQLIAEAEKHQGKTAQLIISKLSKALDKMTDSKARLNFKPLSEPAAASERDPEPKRSGSGNRKGRTKGAVAAPSEAISKADLLAGIPVITDFSDIDEVQGLSGGNKVYDYITERIAAKIKKGGLFWRERWKKSKLLNIPGINFASKKAYNGINFLLTHGQMRLHDSPYFLTMKQANRLGGKVKEGSDGYPVVFYKKIIRDKETGEIVEKKERGKKYNEYFALRYYLVFNSADIEGIDFNLPKEQELNQIDFHDISIAEKIVEGMPKRPPIKHEGSRAFYMPVKDSVTMPPKERFKMRPIYYSTLFHELVHSTMHKSRLHRKAPKKILATDHYAFEELVAELGASFLNSEANILYHNMGSSAAYLEGYQKSILGAMENDNKFIFKASAYAQKAADYILNGKSYREEFLKPAKKKVADRKPKGRNVKANIKTAVQEVRENIERFKDITQAQGEWLYNTWKNDRKMILDEPEAAIPKNFVKKLAFTYLDEVSTMTDDGLRYELTELGNDFIARVEARLQTRKGLKKGTDMFPSKKDSKVLDGLPAEALAKAGIQWANEAPAKKPDNVFRLKGEQGKFLGDLQRYKLAINLKGDFHAGKSEYVKQLINDFADINMNILLADLEQGGLASKDTVESINRNITPENRKRVAVTGEAESLEDITKWADKFDVIVIDSWQKFGFITNEGFDQLRKDFPNTIFVVIFQQNAEGGTRGGSAADFDAPVALKVHRVDWHTYKNNYVSIEKNRGNRTDLRYMIADKKTIEIESLKSEKEEENV
jgi:antirestriction protein ArdC